MTYAELKQEDYSYKMYEYLKTFLAIHDQIPIKAIRINNNKNTKIIIIKQTQTGAKAITTRQCDIPTSDVDMFLHRLTEDFPIIELEYIDRE